MIYYIDFEFIEGFHKPLLGKRRHFIDMISVGIVAEDGREYYAISNEFDLKEAWNRWQWEETNKTDLPGITRSKIKKYWLRDNVLKPIWIDLEYREYREDPNDMKQQFYDILDLKSHADQLKIFAAEILPHGSSSFNEWARVFSKI